MEENNYSSAQASSSDTAGDISTTTQKKAESSSPVRAVRTFASDIELAKERGTLVIPEPKRSIFSRLFSSSKSHTTASSPAQSTNSNIKENVALISQTPFPSLNVSSSLAQEKFKTETITRPVTNTDHTEQLPKENVTPLTETSTSDSQNMMGEALAQQDIQSNESSATPSEGNYIEREEVTTPASDVPAPSSDEDNPDRWQQGYYFTPTPEGDEEAQARAQRLQEQSDPFYSQPTFREPQETTTSDRNIQQEPISPYASPRSSAPLSPEESATETGFAAPSSFNSRPQTPETTKFTSSLSPIRTFELDASDTIESQKGSAINIALAEQKRREQFGGMGMTEVQESSGSTLKLLAISFLLIVAGIGALGLFYYFYLRESRPVEVTKPAKQTPVSSDKEKDVSLPQLERDALIEDLRNEVRETAQAQKNSIVSLNLQSNSADITLEKFFTSISAKVPPALMRSFESGFTYGIHVTDSSNPFLIAKTRSYEIAYPGMLEWETTLYADIGPFMWPNSSAPGNITPASPNLISAFKDERIRNKSIRVLKNTDGQVLLMYTFLDNNTIAITAREATLRELIGRLTSTRFER